MSDRKKCNHTGPRLTCGRHFWGSLALVVLLVIKQHSPNTPRNILRTTTTRELHEVNPGMCSVCVHPDGTQPLTGCNVMEIKHLNRCYTWYKRLIRGITLPGGLESALNAKKRRMNSLFAEFPVLYCCYISHVENAVFGKINWRSRIARIRKLDGAFTKSRYRKRGGECLNIPAQLILVHENIKTPLNNNTGPQHEAFATLFRPLDTGVSWLLSLFPAAILGQNKQGTYCPMFFFNFFFFYCQWFSNVMVLVVALFKRPSKIRTIDLDSGFSHT